MEEIKKLPQTLESRATILFEHCDPFGHLNNVNYINYFFNARDGQVRNNYDLDFYEYQKQSGKNWVVKKSKLAYQYPALLREEVLIRTRIVDLQDSSIVIEAMMLDKEGKRVKCLFWAEFSFIDVSTGRSSSITNDLRELMSAVQYADFEYAPEKFDSRLKEVSKETRDLYRKVEASERELVEQVA